MILTVAVLLTAIGLACWLLGTIFEYTEIAVIGAIVVVAVGGAITLGGLTHKTGEVKDTSVANRTQVSYVYKPVPLPKTVPFGPLVMLVGGMLFIRPMFEEGLE